MASETKIYAVVTGACSGIGYQFARTLAADHYCLVMVSDRDNEIHSAASKIESDFNVTTIPLCLDLSQSDSITSLVEICAPLDVKVLINNAGIFSFSDLHAKNQSLANTMLKLHVEAVSRLTLIFAQRMKEHEGGYILNSSSLAGFFPFPGIALYSATKGYIRLFSESLWHEYHPYGVNILSLCPGAVATDLYGLSPFYQNLGIRLGIICRPENMVKKALRALFRGRRSYIPYPFINIPLKVIMSHLPLTFINYIYKNTRKFQK